MSRIFASLMIVLSLAAGASADVKLPHIFSSHMVLQQDKPIIVWGWATPGEAVAVNVGTSTGKTNADEKGEWKVTLDPLKATDQPLTMTVSAGNKIVFDDVLVGEVWVCSGQSNMEFGVGMLSNAKEEIAAADHPHIRLMKVLRDWKASPQSDMNGEWKVCSPESIAQGGWNGFTATGYFFGRELNKQLNVPVGLIDATWGGTVIQSWTPPVGFATVPGLKTENDRLQLGMPGSAEHDKRLSDAIDQISAWTTQAKKAVDEHTLPSAPPVVPAELLGANNVQSPTALFNGMIHPVIPFGIRGAIWYQGESNVGEGMLYAEHMKGLIGGWRSLWGEGDFPFYFVQLAPYNYGNKPENLPRSWEAQSVAEKQIPNTGMAVVNDIGNVGDIHPKNKQEVGRRLALRALTDTYGKTDLLSKSPTYQTMSTEGSTLRVAFDNAGTGLASRDGKPLTWFEIADASKGVYVQADAKIDGNCVVLSAPGVESPVAVRFAWNQIAEPNLVNSAGLPASAFRAGEMPKIDFIKQNVPEAKDYQLVYDLDLSKLGSTISYSTDNHAAITQPFDRVAYAMELHDSSGKWQWVYVSMDAFTTDAGKIGVPTVTSGETFQKPLNHLNVFSNVTGVVTGNDLAGGNIEFWPNNYNPINSAKVAGASDQTYDFGDQMTEPAEGYGSMQIHNHDAKQTIFSLNHWSEEDHADIGIGNGTGKNPDWTFAENAGSYSVKRLRVFVHVK